MNNKKILFLSALDFKEKSIQVIRKTPEAFVSAGWEVDYIVARDSSKKGNYFYEKVINPNGVNITRFEMPLKSLKDKISNHTLRTIISKISGYFTIVKLAYNANKVLKEREIDIIYGYEVHGVLAVWLLKVFGKVKQQKKVHRFQGTFYIIIIKSKQYLKRILNWESFLALKLDSDLCIMTNDGTQGDQALKYIKSKSLSKMKFWVNGVDEQKFPEDEIKILKQKLNIKNEIIFLTVCRMERWKRVDRGIRVINILKKKYNLSNFKYYIIGDGVEKNNLVKLVKKLQLEDNIIFTGAIANNKVKEYLSISDIFISTYDSSNVGNPLLEAVRANKIIFTLNNGDTNKWIIHKKNGFIYDINDNLLRYMAEDMHKVIQNNNLKIKILENIKTTEKKKLWTWKERMDIEIKEMENLIEN